MLARRVQATQERVSRVRSGTPRDAAGPIPGGAARRLRALGPPDGPALERALRRGDLRLVYHPEVLLATGAVCGVEALVRWQHPTRGLLAPPAFLGLAKAAGLIATLGDWVLTDACRQLARWQRTRRMGPGFTLSVNLSATQLDSPRFVESVAATLAATGVPATALRLELTESVPLREDAHTHARLLQLRQLGVQLALDDFGTGSSSLRDLARLPVQALKLDQSLVQALCRDARTATIVAAIVALAAQLELEVVAEAIEAPAQQARLLELGCARGQGYLFSRPLPAAALTPLLRGVLPATAGG